MIAIGMEPGETRGFAVGKKDCAQLWIQQGIVGTDRQGVIRWGECSTGKQKVNFFVVVLFVGFGSFYFAFRHGR